MSPASAGLLLKAKEMFYKEVTLDLEKFRKLYPKFSDRKDYPAEVLEGVFEEASMYVPTFIPYNPDKNIFTRELLIYKAMCHFLMLNDMGESGSPGRVASASQGSVSTSFDLVKTGSADDDFWLQTPCGQMFWKMLRRFAVGGRFYGFKTRHPFG